MNSAMESQGPMLVASVAAGLLIDVLLAYRLKLTSMMWWIITMIGTIGHAHA